MEEIIEHKITPEEEPLRVKASEFMLQFDRVLYVEDYGDKFLKYIGDLGIKDNKIRISYEEGKPYIIGYKKTIEIMAEKIDNAVNKLKYAKNDDKITELNKELLTNYSHLKLVSLNFIEYMTDLIQINKIIIIDLPQQKIDFLQSGINVFINTDKKIKEDTNLSFIESDDITLFNGKTYKYTFRSNEFQSFYEKYKMTFGSDINTFIKNILKAGLATFVVIGGITFVIVTSYLIRKKVTSDRKKIENTLQYQNIVKRGETDITKNIRKSDLNI